MENDLDILKARWDDAVARRKRAEAEVAVVRREYAEAAESALLAEFAAQGIEPGMKVRVIERRGVNLATGEFRDTAHDLYFAGAEIVYRTAEPLFHKAKKDGTMSKVRAYVAVHAVEPLEDKA